MINNICPKPNGPPPISKPTPIFTIFIHVKIPPLMVKIYPKTQDPSKLPPYLTSHPPRTCG